MIPILVFLCLLSTPVLAQDVAFSDRAEMEVKWSTGNAQLPVPKDHTGEWQPDFWLLEGPQNGTKNGAIRVQMNFRQKAVYDKATADTGNYTLKKVVTPEVQAVEAVVK